MHHIHDKNSAGSARHGRKTRSITLICSQPGSEEQQKTFNLNSQFVPCNNDGDAGADAGIVFIDDNRRFFVGYAFYCVNVAPGIYRVENFQTDDLLIHFTNIM